MSRLPASGVWILALATGRESVRRRLVLAATLAGAAFLLLYGLAFYSAIQHPHNGINASDRLLARQLAALFLMLGLYAANLLVALMAILGSMDALSGDIASGAIQTLLTKPLPRWQYFLGKWLGLVALLTLFLLAVEGGVMAIAWRFSRYTAPHALYGLLLMWLEMVLLLTVTLLWGTRFSTLASGAFSLGLFGVAFLGGWIEQFGAVAHQPRAVQVGIVASLIMPSEALWRRAAFEMQSPLSSALGIGPFVSLSVPSPQMVVYAVIYTAAVLALALRRFHLRDL